MLDQHARQQPVQLNVALEIDTLSAMKDVALTGAACTILPLMAVREEVAQGSLVAQRITEPAIRRVIALSVTHQRMLSRAGRLTVSRLRDLVSRFLTDPQ